VDPPFLPHNSHLEDPAGFTTQDPQLRRLHRQPYQYRSEILGQLPVNTPGIFTLGGGRQIGKTTLLKQWMADLLAKGVDPQAIAFFSGELIDDHHSLLSLMQDQLSKAPTTELNYLIIDQVTYIGDWDKAVKYAADAGLLEETVLMLTGSDLYFIQEARMRFPGRRGKADTADFHLYPLSFREFLLLKNKVSDLDRQIADPNAIEPGVLDTIYQEFDQYLLHGGYLTAINDLAEQETITPATLRVYSDWVRGDMLKRGKQEHYLKEVLAAIIKRYNSQVTWNALASDLSIDHPKTVADYMGLLERMDMLFIQAALLEDKLTAAPKKARRLMFCDPFIFHAIRAWIEPVKDAFNEQLMPAVRDPVWASKLVEACVVTHHRRFFPTYYLKAEGEVDLAYVDKNRCWPVEIKWTNQLRPKDLKQIAKYPNGEIWGRAKQPGSINGVKSYSLPIKLLQLGGAAGHAEM
jgi:uncharacterized protein